MRTRKTILLNKDNPTFYLPLPNNQSFNISGLINKSKYLIEALISGNPQKPPTYFSLVDQSIYGMNTQMHNAIELRAQPFSRDEDFISLDIVIY